jgi:hypothetical protein
MVINNISCNFDSIKDIINVLSNLNTKLETLMLNEKKWYEKVTINYSSFYTGGIILLSNLFDELISINKFYKEKDYINTLSLDEIRKLYTNFNSISVLDDLFAFLYEVDYKKVIMQEEGYIIIKCIDTEGNTVKSFKISL